MAKRICLQIAVLTIWCIHVHAQQVENDQLEITYQILEPFLIKNVGLSEQADERVRDSKGYGLLYVLGLGEVLGLTASTTSVRYKARIYHSADLKLEGEHPEYDYFIQEVKYLDYNIDLEVNTIRYGMRLSGGLYSLVGLTVRSEPKVFIEGGMTSSAVKGTVDLVLEDEEEPVASLKAVKSDDQHYWLAGVVIAVTEHIHFSFYSKKEETYRLQVESCNSVKLGITGCDGIKKKADEKKQYDFISSISFSIGTNW